MSENGDERPQGRRRFFQGRNNNNNHHHNNNHNNNNRERNGDRGGNNNSDEKELASQQVQIQSKRFYIDVKENQRGRFIKLAEVGVGGRKSRILMSMGAAADFNKHLVEFSDLHSSMGPSSPPSTSESPNNNNESKDRDDGLIKSETIIKDRKRYYLDFKENQRGRFLRVSMVMQRGPRAQIAIPAQGLIEFKDHLTDMLEKFTLPSDGTEQTDEADAATNNNGQRSNHKNENSHQNGGEGASGGPTAESKSMRADNKTFYFDHGSNPRGVFLRVTEVRQNSRYRTSITVPDKFLHQFRDQILEFIDEHKIVEGGAPVAEPAATETLATTLVEGATHAIDEVKSAISNGVSKIKDAIAANVPAAAPVVKTEAVKTPVEA